MEGEEANPTFPKREKVFWSQTGGLLVKNLHFQRRQRVDNCCSFIFPAILLLLVRALGSAFTELTETPSLGETNPNGGFAPLPFPIDLCDDNFFAGSAGICSSTPFIPQPFNVPIVDNTGSAGALSNPICQFTGDPEEFVESCIEVRASAPTTASGVMGQYSLYPMEYPPFAQDLLTPQNRSSILDYEFEDDSPDTPDQLRPDVIQLGEANPALPLTDVLYGTKSSMFGSVDELHSEFYDSWRRPGNIFSPYFGGIVFDRMEGLNGTGPLVVEATVYYNNSLQENCATGRCQVLSGVSRLLNAVMGTVSPGNTAFSYIRKFPLFEREENIDIIGLILTILLGILLHFLMPGFMSLLTYERTSRVRITMEMMGLRKPVYWLGTYLSLLLIYLLAILVILIVGGAIRLDFFTLNTPASYLPLFVLWGNAMISFIMFLVPFFQTPETALIFGWFYVILLNFIGGPYLGQLYTTDADESTFNAVSILPSFAFLRGLYYLGAFNAGGQGVTIGEEIYGYDSLKMCGPGPICIVYGYLAAQWVIFGVLGIYLDRVLPSPSGTRDHPLFFLGKKRTASKDEQATSANLAEDVNAEARAAAGEESTDYGIVVRNLRKTFPGKVAVGDLSLAIPRGELFGLLGHNGAGKTTTISILTGLMGPSGGSAELDGNDVETSMKEIYKAMGVCPQFDVVWSDLTGAEHLYFYARLKGFYKRDQKEVVARSLESVGLTEAAKRKVGQYSGGMRRRLSVAICLMGDPSIVFLDEPTTGLDPKSKHSLWDCLQARKAGKTMILTTHSMEEAERLCDRIGIMAEGKLKCIGPPEEVKLRLGKGYRLTVSLPEENVDELSGIVSGISSEATLQASLAGSVIYQLPRSVVLSDVFAKIEDNTGRLGITNWGISQSTLEDIFVDVTHEEHQSTFVDSGPGDDQV